MKTCLIWLIALTALSVANEFWSSSHSCCAVLIPEQAVSANDDKPNTESIAKQRESLSKLKEYVGQWRGVGQPKRGSTKDSWIEKSAWAWKFGNNDVALRFHSDDAKYFHTAELRPGKNADEYDLVAKTQSGSEVKYVGKLGPDGLTLTSTNSVEGTPARISIRLVANGDRLGMLYERQTDPEHFTRLAEVFSTREGSGFGKGTSYVECVVTGGLGTIAVMHQGKTYYVCCTGCRDYFNDNPDEVLAEYRARQAEKKK